VTVGVVNQAGADIDDVPVALEEHRANRALGDVEEAGQIYGGDGGEVVGRVLVERLADEEARIVYETVDSAETPGRRVNHAPRGVALGDVTLDGEKPGSSLKLIERDVPTTA
jgi:hypothetical protein